ncbi:DUF202 domain-containing protein [Streptomyces werraensis]|uniref:DUF202 domain-containing protein n=1 Tax=Streptomyces werraensis TaxID=68284 RepID=UPI00307CAA36
MGHLPLGCRCGLAHRDDTVSRWRRPGADVVGRDPGLQAERTTLARRRTVLAALVSATLAVRLGVVRDSPPALAAGLCLAAAAVSLMGTSSDRRPWLAAGCLAAGGGALLSVQALGPFPWTG